MLSLTRRLGERLFLNDDIVIIVSDIQPGRVRLGIEAPKDVSIEREEVRQSRLAAERSAGLRQPH